MPSCALNIGAVWFYVLLVCVQVYTQEYLYEYKMKSDPCYNNQQYDEYGDYIQSCPTFIATNQWISYIKSYNSNFGDIPQNRRLSLRIIYSDNRTELSANDFPIYSYFFQRTTVLVLDLSHNNIQKILPGVFIAFTDLVELNLTMNSLTALDNYLSPLLKLQKVNISQNSINTISDTSFANQLDLFVVDLSFNNISHIPKNTFTNQKYLEVLLLQGNRIKQFDLNLPDSHGVRLDLSYNLLETAAMSEHFTDINQSHNNLTVFSLVVSPNMQSLDLSYNYIKAIDPSSFVKAVELYKLNLSHNLLTSIPTSSFREVKKLKYLDLSHNLIHENSYGSDNNWYSFFLNFKELSQVALEGNYWKCSDLKDFIYLITSNRAQLTPGSTHNTTNIHGIGCSPSNNTTTSTNKEITYNPSERIQSLINQQITEEFKSLYLNYTTLLAVQTKESKVIMESLNSVKEEISKLKVVLNSLNTTFNATEQKKLNEIVKEEISKLKLTLNSLNTTFNATEQQKNVKEIVKEEISKLKLTLNSLNTTSPNLTLEEDVKTRISNEEITIKILLDEFKTAISKLKEALSPHPSTPEVKTMEHTQSGGNAGIIVSNICLVIVTCCLIFFIYVYYKNKHVVKSFEGEHLNLG